ncbi:hypothetical protein GDO86_016904 [Hymenochirus boettgeri]|uniref:DDB1- and CUL4-associated factor 17 n=1 Tax=Hymenochirus boettgeri TaxID=247094 RepID=A0A8T2II71_9PIPI|nr:hypothetical protein GDO86_016904 [Hymenochirus boettgeri]
MEIKPKMLKLTSQSEKLINKAPSRTVKNICSLVCRRTIGPFPNSTGDIYRNNMGIMRKLVCQKKSIFQRVWTKHSKSAINYTKGRVHFENFRCCFNSFAAKPQQMYEMPRCSKIGKIEDALLCECPMGESLPRPSDYISSLLAVTAHNWLLRISADTGETLEKVYLGSYRKFKYIIWDEPQETLVLKSVQTKSSAVYQQGESSQRDVLFYLAVFKVFPLSLVGILEITKHIFGSNVTDAMISHGMLIVMHSVGLVRLYSFERITEQFMKPKQIIGQTCSCKGESGTIGDYPFGIPCNIVPTESPSFLIEVSCLENAFQVGGNPWHYIITPNKKKERGTYHIRSLDDHSLAKNGIREMKWCSLEPDWIQFHPDDSERIIHVGPDQISVLKLKELQEDSYRCQVIEDFAIFANRDREASTMILLVINAI